MPVRGCLAQSVTSLTADPGVGRSIPARSHTFVEIDREIISTVILLLYILLSKQTHLLFLQFTHYIHHTSLDNQIDKIKFKDKQALR